MKSTHIDHRVGSVRGPLSIRADEDFNEMMRRFVRGMKDQGVTVRSIALYARLSYGSVRTWLCGQYDFRYDWLDKLADGMRSAAGVL